MNRIDYRAWASVSLFVVVLAYAGCSAKPDGPASGVCLENHKRRTRFRYHRPPSIRPRSHRAPSLKPSSTPWEIPPRSCSSRASKTATWSRAAAPRTRKGA